MFKLLREKLKSTLGRITERIDKEAEEVEIPNEEPAEKGGFFSRLKEKLIGKEEAAIPAKPEPEKHEHGKKEAAAIKEAVPAAKEAQKKAERHKAPAEQVKPRASPGTMRPIILPSKQEKNKAQPTVPIPEKPIEIQQQKQLHVPDQKPVYIPEDEKEYVEPSPEENALLREIGAAKKLSAAAPEAVQPEAAMPASAPEKSPDTDQKTDGQKGFFTRLKESITMKKISESQFEDIFWDLELGLLENNVAVKVIDKIKDDLKKDIVDKPVPRTRINQLIALSLKGSIESLFTDTFDLLEKIKGKKPYIICFVGINGSGKTTTIAKLIKLLKDNKLNCVVAAADTFRAAAIDQLEQHANALQVKMIKHDYGADPAAVAFDTIKYAKAKSMDVVLIDTAGRMHSNSNLIDEMKKIVRVAKPDLKLFIGESITGNDCTEQAEKFNEAIGIDGIILAKADIDEKGGAAISVSYVTKKPILFLGIGQEYPDLEAFDAKKIVKSIGLEA